MYPEARFMQKDCTNLSEEIANSVPFQRTKWDVYRLDSVCAQSAKSATLNPANISSTKWGRAR